MFSRSSLTAVDHNNDLIGIHVENNDRQNEDLTAPLMMQRKKKRSLCPSSFSRLIQLALQVYSVHLFSLSMSFLTSVDASQTMAVGGSAVTITLMALIELSAVADKHYTQTRLLPFALFFLIQLCFFLAQLGADITTVTGLLITFTVLYAIATAWSVFIYVERIDAFFSKQKVVRIAMRSFVICKGILIVVVNSGTVCEVHPLIVQGIS